ncbi:hypothetical protein [Sinorhizobium psoraleae]|uniref:Uncharacterized protein n=1 Tax=Sinorhizobium psoraleae TaxID=520838 RepID=A0ABT4KMF7_9HYPH|nr:hypothetical protein [Sinorhizobium psoraleae]MCZ4093104.1 hypothetical protein [Sinorhizobium psoraleae]
MVLLLTGQLILTGNVLGGDAHVITMEGVGLAIPSFELKFMLTREGFAELSSSNPGGNSHALADRTCAKNASPSTLGKAAHQIVEGTLTTQRRSSRVAPSTRRERL